MEESHIEREKTKRWLRVCLRFFSFFFRNANESAQWLWTPKYKLSPILQWLQWRTVGIGRKENVNACRVNQNWQCHPLFLLSIVNVYILWFKMEDEITLCWHSIWLKLFVSTMGSSSFDEIWLHGSWHYGGQAWPTFVHLTGYKTNIINNYWNNNTTKTTNLIYGQLDLCSEWDEGANNSQDPEEEEEHRRATTSYSFQLDDT